jgi:transcription elongation factor/antiterminator RfaH
MPLLSVESQLISTTAAVNSVPGVVEMPLWYVAYTRPRHEKYIGHQLEERGVRTFVPLYTSIRRWKDRRKRLELPLFPGYVFVQIALQNKLDLLRLPGVVDFVRFQGKPVPLLSGEIEILRVGLANSALMHPHPYLQAGRRVRIRRGVLDGIEGIFVRRRGQTRVVLSVSLIQRSVAIEVEEADVEPLSVASCGAFA